jgi:hypothetical protein
MLIIVQAHMSCWSLGLIKTVSVFRTGKNRMVKIVRSSFEMVLRTIKHTMIFSGSVPYLKVIALHPAV